MIVRELAKIIDSMDPDEEIEAYVLKSPSTEGIKFIRGVTFEIAGIKHFIEKKDVKRGLDLKEQISDELKEYDNMLIENLRVINLMVVITPHE